MTRTRAVLIVREQSNPPPSLQLEKTREYALSHGFEIAGTLRVSYASRSRLIADSGLRLRLMKPDVVVVYDWGVFGYACRVVIRFISAVFSAGAGEIHTVHGDVLTREEWTRHLGFLRRFLTPSHRKRRSPMLMEKVLRALPLTAEEAREIYNALARDDPTLLPIRHISEVLSEMDAQEIIQELASNEDGG